MIQDILTSVMPKTLLGVAVVYGAATYFITAPVIQDRATEKHLEGCVSGMQADLVKARRLRAPGQGELVSGFVKNLFQGAHAKEFAKHYGINRMLDGYAEKVRAQDRAREAEERAKEPVPEAVCRCELTEAKKRTTAQFALWVGSLKLIRPIEVSRFPGVMASVRAEKRCIKKGS